MKTNKGGISVNLARGGGSAMIYRRAPRRVAAHPELRANRAAKAMPSASLPARLRVPRLGKILKFVKKYAENFKNALCTPHAVSRSCRRRLLS
ncbi:hypothetical protein EVAR_84383_1 [Eumeta japonica]|uniref:Uncharacterized protein n=1 Tax=Eumeta variegata TaxID=151549 RepID=A0A4C1U5Y8_EUMVA|nr:hypothetical protein EVAR_84383_1 [Eumeta japonica]